MEMSEAEFKSHFRNRLEDLFLLKEDGIVPWSLCNSDLTPLDVLVVTVLNRHPSDIVKPNYKNFLQHKEQTIETLIRLSHSTYFKRKAVDCCNFCLESTKKTGAYTGEVEKLLKAKTKFTT